MTVFFGMQLKGLEKAGGHCPPAFLLAELFNSILCPPKTLCSRPHPSRPHPPQWHTRSGCTRSGGAPAPAAPAPIAPAPAALAPVAPATTAHLLRLHSFRSHLPRPHSYSSCILPLRRRTRPDRTPAPAATPLRSHFLRSHFLRSHPLRQHPRSEKGRGFFALFVIYLKTFVLCCFCCVLKENML